MFCVLLFFSRPIIRIRRVRERYRQVSTSNAIGQMVISTRDRFGLQDEQESERYRGGFFC